jgi:hypothetical protein
MKAYRVGVIGLSFGYDTSPKAITCKQDRMARSFYTLSSIRTVTVGPGISPGLLDPFTRKALAGLPMIGLTAGGEFRPALRTGKVFANVLPRCKLLGAKMLSQPPAPARMG